MSISSSLGEQKTVSLPAGTIAYRERGEGLPVVFVHGVGVNGDLWRGVVPTVAGEHRCISPDLPLGSHSHPLPADADLSLPGLARIVADLLEALDLHDVAIVANDTGGAVAQAFTVRNPDRVRTRTLTNCEADDWMPSKNQLGQLVKQLAEQGQLAPLVKGFYDDIPAARQSAFADPYQWPDRISDEQLRAIMEPHQATLEGAQRIERFAAALVSDDLAALEPKLRELEVPTIAVWGTGDDIFPLELAHWLRDTIPGFIELYEVEGGKLFWPFERPDELVPHVRRLWAATAPVEA
jgi:pimeloyl-ACP methyl ester carboxylesterase